MKIYSRLSEWFELEYGLHVFMANLVKELKCLYHHHNKKVTRSKKNSFKQNKKEK